MADIYVFENNAGSTLLTGIGSGDTQLTVAAGEGVRFPAPAAGEIAALTLVDSILGLLEIVTLTVRAGDLMTIVRGAEGTTPLAFSAGTTVSHRVTKGTLEWLQGLSAAPAGGTLLLAPASGNEQVITPGDAADIGLAIQGVISQVGNLQEWRNSAAAIKVSISPDGALIAAELIQGQRLKSTIAGSEAVPSIRVGGDLHGLRLFGARFAVVVNNTDAAVFEEELVSVGSLDNLSLITKRLGDLLYFPLAGGVLQGPLKLEDSDPFLDLADADAPAFPGFNRIRLINGMQAFTIELRDNSESLLANILKVSYDVNGATAIENYIAGTLAAAVAAVGTASPAPETVITREKGDARFAPIAHVTDPNDPHDVQATQVDYSGALGSTVQQALDALESVPPGGVQTVFGRSGFIVAVLADYQAFYVDLAGSVMTGQLELPGGGSGLDAATVNDITAKIATHTGLTNPHSVTAVQAGAVDLSDKASQAEAEAGSDDNKWMTPLKTQQAIDELSPPGIVRGTRVVTTSGTEANFTGIAAGASLIHVMFFDVSFDGGNEMMIQIGDSGGIDTDSNYRGHASNRASETANTTGFRVTLGMVVGGAVGGVITLARIDENKWGLSGQLSDGSVAPFKAAGQKELPGELTQIRVRPVGSDDFDGGVINILVQ